MKLNPTSVKPFYASDEVKVGNYHSPRQMDPEEFWNTLKVPNKLNYVHYPLEALFSSTQNRNSFDLGL